MTGWVEHAIWWQVYPLGFAGAYPAEPPPRTDEHRLRRVTAWLDHAVRLGASGVALGPIFTSGTHGYDTVDHFQIDPRLGDDADFDELVDEAHRRGLRILLDGVFNHVGTGFPRYRQALDGQQTGWFRRRGAAFDTFEGHDGLIALDHDDPEVADYTAEVMSHWLGRGADGWRLDAAYAVPDRFWSTTLAKVRQRFPDAWFVGEVIHGDYPSRVKNATFDSVTQYELWKAIWSSLNDANFHELDWALKRHNEFLDTFVPLTFIGNHDVTRIASQLGDRRHLEHALVLLMTVGGTPSIYAGDEWGRLGIKEERFGGDDAVRPEFPCSPDEPDNDVTRLHRHLIGLRRRHAWLHTARTRAVTLDNQRYVYRAENGRHALAVALNLADRPLQLPMTEVGADTGRIIAGSGAPDERDVASIDVRPHGWAIFAL